MKALVVLVVLSAFASGGAVEWVRPLRPGDPLRWGVGGRLNFAIPPTWGGPRGLIRLLSPTLAGGAYDLVNFVAIEPIVHGRRGYSELERSALDSVQGKRISAPSPAGTVRRRGQGVEELSVRLQIERFENGACVELTASIGSDRPDELCLTVHAQKGCAPMEYCILTATMGNKARARVLWLDGGREECSRLWPSFEGNGFAPPIAFPAKRMLKTPTGDLYAAITTDETDPSKAVQLPGSEGWVYLGRPVTQYWLKRRGSARPGLEVVVGARATYWGNHRAIPGGPAFENFELREPFYQGQSFVIGITAEGDPAKGVIAFDPGRP